MWITNIFETFVIRFMHQDLMIRLPMHLKVAPLIHLR